ncbi:RTA1 like protein-domain-containing protein [Ilyonectria sp. MPI-CAGE-AT-0026]|nr:RTA1 like protein-domain-containing protein [Ilyonectria sp. MPI-CAGE-AT-0026]
MANQNHPTYSSCDSVSPQCPVSATLYGDFFAKGPTLFFSIAFGTALLVQVYLGWKSRAWSFVSWLAIGTILELAGYISRVAMSSNPWNFPAFATQLLTLILAPTFVAAAISITCKYFVLYYGPELSPIRPKLYPWIFVGSDFLSIVIQGAGAFVAAAATSSDPPNKSLSDVSAGLLITGVSFQVANMLGCACIMVVFWRRYRNNHLQQGTPEGSSGCDMAVDMNSSRRHTNVQLNKRKIRIFVWAVIVAFIAIIIRCIYRVPEMASGWGRSLMKDELAFLILDGAMILISVVLLSVIHPCVFFPLVGNEKMVTELNKNTIPLKERSRRSRHRAV